ncbi:MAG: hypothetical protein HRU15_00075 [Planctomycetes bacterium]|nr:hypothetical protein [Planctomycetota bacterium]
MSELHLDYTNCVSTAIGATHGLTDAEMETLIVKIPKHHENIAELHSNRESGFFDLPEQDLSQIHKLIKTHQNSWDNLVVIGIGGASYGPQSLVGALAPEHRNVLDAKKRVGPKLFYIDNADPYSIESTLEAIQAKKTLFLLISKSGTTAEAVALYLWLQNFLKENIGKTAISKQLIISTNTNSSPLAELANNEKCEIIAQPHNIGNRFSVLGPSSLFVAGLCGIDIDAVLAGAKSMRERCWHGDARKNPAYMHSLIHYLLTRKRRKTIHATMGFSNRLAGSIQWYNHLLAVSLGKMLNKKGKAVHVGPSPTSCIGPNGLHGQMQLYAEGPFDKVVTFITVKDHGSSIEIPASPSDLEPIAYIGGNKIEDIIDHSYYTAAQTITAAGRPNMTIILDAIDPQSIGGLYYMLQLSTVMSAELYGIDAFDQPGVDANKQGVFAQLGRAGFEDKDEILKAYKTREQKVC